MNVGFYSGLLTINSKQYIIKTSEVQILFLSLISYIYYDAKK
jgi:hypothetical protein